MKQATTVERILLKELFCSDTPVAIYHFHEKWKLSPFQLTLAIESLEKESLIDFHSTDKIWMTEKGKALVFRNRKQIFQDIDYYWKRLIYEVKKNRLDINEPYLPDLKSLDKKYFFRLNKRRRGTGH